MKPLLCLSLAVACTAFVAPVPAALAQANVNESDVRQVLYVAPADKSAGATAAGTTPDQPLHSLQAAVDRAANVATKIVLLPGVFRELVTIPAGDALLIIEAKEIHKSTLSGADVVTGWTDAGSGVYSCEWTHGVGPMPENHFGIDWSPLQRRRETALVNGKPLQQVLGREDLKENTFCVADAEKKVYIKPAANVDFKSAVVELSVRGADRYGQGRNGALLVMQGHKNVVVRGLNVSHSMCGIKQNAVSGSAENILFEDCSFDWNNGVGLDMSLKNATFRRCTGNHNGERGMGLGRSEHVSIEECECSENNWRFGERINGHDAAGFKAFWDNRDITFRHFRAVNNGTSGIWFDWNNGPITISDSLFENNKTAGINYEANPLGLTVTDSVIRRNDIGIIFYGSSNVTLRGCAIYGNGHAPDRWGDAGGQILIVADDRVIKQGDWAQHYLHEGYKPQPGDHVCTIDTFTIENCIIECTADKQYLFHASTQNTGFSTKAAVQWCKAIRSDANTYWQPSSDKGFFSNVMKNTWEDDHTQLTLEQWQQQSKQDAHSTWKASDLTAVRDPTSPTR